MNDFVHSDLLSHFGEVTANHGESDQTDSSRFDLDGTRLLLRHVLRLPDSGIGSLSCISEILRDLRPALEMDSDLSEWVDVLACCKKQIEQSTLLSEAKDRHLLQGIDTWPMRMLLAPLSSQFSPDARLQIRLIRAKVILHHLSNHRPFSKNFCQNFVELSTAKTDTAKILGQVICCDRSNLMEARRGFTPESSIYAFTTTLINCIDAPLKSPPRIRAQQISPIALKRRFKEDEEDENESSDDIRNPSTSSEDGISKPKQSGEPAEEKAANENDQIGIDFLETKYSRPRDFSGINNLWDYLQPSELEFACKQFVVDLDGPNNTVALAALIAVFTRLRPKAFGSLPLSWNKSASLWLDMNSGHLCWQLEAAIDRKRWLLREENWIGRSPIRIPLPKELTDRLEKMLTIIPSASTLGDLFGGHLTSLETLTRKYVKDISTTSHRVTLGRLRSSHGRYLLSQCNDEAYACVLGLDFRLGTTSSANYCTFKSSKVNTILKVAYLQLGLSGNVAVPVEVDIGSRFIGKIDAVDRIISKSLNEALSAFSRVIDRHDFASLAAAHGTISRSILRVLCIVTQHRESSRHSFAHHTIDLERMLALISDKDISPYLHTRIVPIPEMVVDWLNFYFKWLELIRYRFLKIDRQISKYADSIILSSNIRADGSLFFDINDNGAVTPLRNRDISELFKQFGLEGNAGRHWADDIFRDAGFDSAILMACAGHACNGQEAFGIRSALDPMRICDAARQALDNKLDKLNLPRPPALQARKCPIQFVHQHNFIPGGFGAMASDDPPVEPIWEFCPFDEFTLAHARQFIDICKHWHSAAQSPSPATIALSLVFRDGIANRSELLAGTKELLTGRIFQNDKVHFIDTDTKELGIRRIWLDPATFRLASKITFVNPIVEELLSEVQRAFSEVAGSWEVPVVVYPVDEVLKRSRAFYSLFLPGILRGWSFGEVHARTLRPEAVARHISDLVEHPSIEGGRNHRSSHIGALDKFITEAISDACDETTYKGREDTRIRNLIDELSEFEDMPLNNGVLEVLLKFALYLARNLTDPSSVRRYYSGIKAFIVTHCFSLDSIDDFSEIEWQEPVVEFRDLRVAATGNSSDPERVALNHFLDCMRIDRVILRSADPASASRRYADFPSLNEVSRVLQIIPEISVLSEARTSQAQTAFDVLVQRHLRWSEVSRLRVTDIGLCEPPSIVFTHEAIGKHKTENADRVHTHIEHRISNSLAALSQLRLNQFPTHYKAFLFCNRESCKSISQATEIHHLISDALWSASGSNFLSVHSGRRTLPTSFVQSILDPELRSNMSPLYLRQVFYLLAASIGHGDPLTTFANYICELDKSRRKWVNSIYDTAGIKALPAFVASLIDKPVDTIRARGRRNSPLAKTDFLEDFDPAANLAFQSRIRPLNEFVVKDTTRLTVDPKQNSEDEALSCCVYVAATILKTDKELAAFISQISTTNQKTIDLGLKRIHDAFGRPFISGLGIFPTQLLNDEVLVSASNSFSPFHPDIGTSLMLCRAISQPDKPWQISNNDDIPPLSHFMQYLDESFIEVVISRNRDCMHDTDTFLVFSGRKFRHRKIHARHFPRGCKLRFQFVPAGTTLSTLPAKTGLTTFAISAVAISRFALSLGEHHEQAVT